MFVALAAVHQRADGFECMLGVFQLHNSAISFVLCDTKKQRVFKVFPAVRRRGNFRAIEPCCKTLTISDNGGLDVWQVGDDNATPCKRRQDDHPWMLRPHPCLLSRTVPCTRR